MADTCPTCGMDDHECIGDSHSRCPDPFHYEPAIHDTCIAQSGICEGCPEEPLCADEPATPPVAPTVDAPAGLSIERLSLDEIQRRFPEPATVAARREAVLRDSDELRCIECEFEGDSPRVDKMEAELTRLWAVEDAANGLVDWLDEDLDDGTAVIERGTTFTLYLRLVAALKSNPTDTNR